MPPRREGRFNSPRGRGRGRGDNSPGRPFRGRGRGRGGRGGGYAHTSAELDFVLQVWPQSNDSRRGSGYSTPRGAGIGSTGRGGRGRGSGYDSPRGGGRGRGRGRGRGGYDTPHRGRGGYDSPRGRGGPKVRGHSNAPLSKLLYGERPYLKPIVFVPSGFLFKDEEEIFKPGVEELDEQEEQSHVPTADRVSRVFSGTLPHDLGHLVQDKSELEEVDFNDLGQFHQQIDFSSLPPASEHLPELKQEHFTGIIPSSTSAGNADAGASQSRTEPTALTEQFHSFVIDSEPASSAHNLSNASAASILANKAYLEPEPEEEIVVYPRSERASPVPQVREHGPSMRSVLTGLPLGARRREQQSAGVEVLQPAEASEHRAGEVAGRLESAAPYASSTTEPSAIPATSVPAAHVTSPVAPAAMELVDVYASETNTPVVSVAPPASTLPQPEVPPDNVEAVEQLLTSPLLQSIAPSADELPAPEEPESLTSPKASTSVPISSPPAPAAAPVQSPTASTSSPLRARPIRAHKTKALLRAHRKEIHLSRNARSKTKMRVQLGSSSGETEEIIELDVSDEELGLERREGSDIDWGTESDSPKISKRKQKGKGKMPDALEDIENGEMAVDLDIDPAALRSFANSFSQERSRFMTMDDIADIERMKEEDDDLQQPRTSSDEDEDDEEEDDEEEILELEERMMLGDNDDEDDSEDDDVDYDREDTSFEARLKRLRNAKGKQRRVEPDEDEDGDEAMDDYEGAIGGWTWSDEDDELMKKVQEMLDENQDILSSRDRKSRNKLFRSIQNGSFVEDEWVPVAKRKKDKAADLPPELQAQWEKDRQRKAAGKQAREEERLAAAADPLGPHKGGKKGRKAMRAAARLDPTIQVIPNRIMDMTTLVQQIQTFLGDIGGPQSVSLPPMEKSTRKNVHELAVAYGLKSLSKGKGNGRYTTLTKTTRSIAANVDYRKVQSIVRRSGGRFDVPSGAVYPKDSGKKGVHHREGDEVGKAAPKIGETNKGFKMLASMGWSEGDRIGGSGGLTDPLKAVIKNTKLGLGATR